MSNSCEMEDEAVLDRGASFLKHVCDDEEVEGHHTVYIGVHVPKSYRRRRHHRRRPKERKEKEKITESDVENIDEVGGHILKPLISPAAERIRFILGEDDDSPAPPQLFTELDELLPVDGQELEWKETARWIKFEEKVEQGGERWSKPHVATLSLHSLFELRTCIEKGSILLDLEASTLPQVVEMVVDNQIDTGLLKQDMKDKVIYTLLRKHRHQTKKSNLRSLADIGKTVSSASRMLTNPDNGSPALTPRNLTSSSLNDISDKPDKEQVSFNFLAIGKVEFRSEEEEEEDGKRRRTGMRRRRRRMGRGGGERRKKRRGMGRGGGGGGGGEEWEEEKERNRKRRRRGMRRRRRRRMGRGEEWEEEEERGGRRGGEEWEEEEERNERRRRREEEEEERNGKRRRRRWREEELKNKFMKKLPRDAEASNVLVGEVDFLENPFIAFVRLQQAVMLGALTEVPVPTRFLFILLGPKGKAKSYHEIGRAIATLMSDEVFHDIAYKAKDRQDLIAGIDEFLDEVIVLPPGEWDPAIRIEPPKSLPSSDKRESNRVQSPSQNQQELLMVSVDKWTIVFAQAILGHKSQKNFQATKGVLESFLGTAVTGAVFCLFAGQPLTILSSTGPVLVFERLLFNFSKDNGFDYMEFRLWIGLWSAFLCLILVATDASFLVQYFTRFTEEGFSSLISFIFIYDAFKKMIKLADYYPINSHFKVNDITLYSCTCEPPVPVNSSLINETVTSSPSWLNDMHNDTIEWSSLTKKECLKFGGVLLGNNCKYVPDITLMSCILFLGTYTCSMALKKFKTSRYFPTIVSRVISNKVSQLFLKYIQHHLIKPTHPDRSWFITPFGGNPWWVYLAAAIPALLVTILIFMDQQITAVIVNRKEHKLKKGAGYHLDLFWVAVLMIICSFMGLPWYVAATVISIAHIDSLKMETETSAPGEQPKFLGVREQRVTGCIVFLLTGISVFMAPILKFIPMPVLYGVFLYMGVASLNGVQ
ncbi:Anion exchange protein 4, partial [Ophiophagus hannah]